MPQVAGLSLKNYKSGNDGTGCNWFCHKDMQESLEKNVQLATGFAPQICKNLDTCDWLPKVLRRILARIWEKCERL